MPVFFDAYNDAQLRAILTRELPPNADPALYRNFITSILPMYTATCKSLHELRALLAPLWRRYVKPWEDAKDAIDEARVRRREEKENARVSNGTERGDGNVGDGDVGDGDVGDRDVGDEKSAPGDGAGTDPEAPTGDPSFGGRDRSPRAPKDDVFTMNPALVAAEDRCAAAEAATRRAEEKREALTEQLSDARRECEALRAALADVDPAHRLVDGAND